MKYLSSCIMSKISVSLLAVLIVLSFLGITAAADTYKGYTNVYEPQTSLPLSATVSWQADANAQVAASEEARPASAMVYMDETLRVADENGVIISQHLSQYIEATSKGFIPILYIRDERTALALQTYLKESGKKDVFVAAVFQDAALLKVLTALPHVRGLIDFREMDVASNDDLLFILQAVNGSGSKIALLSFQTATAEAVRYLQTRLLTVWTQVESDRVSLLTALTRGVNGILVSDYRAAYEAIGFFADDAPTLLRVPLIAGHRGMPSEFAENTLMSAKGAFSAGADIIENDIYLSRDGEIFINHDASLKRLFSRGDIADTEQLTLAELQEIPFSFSGMTGVPYSNHTPAAKSRYGSIAEDDSLRIPALREYYETFKDTDIIHFVEIKSHKPQIVTALKNLSEAMGTVGQTVVISFNSEILEEMQRVWPEMSLGALGTEGANFLGGRPGFMDYTSITKGEGKEKALEYLYRVLGAYNATYNPKFTFTYDVVKAGRHRGLTVWPWTYNDPKVFSEAYLGGVYGLTTNFAWWASDLAIRVRAEDQTLMAGESIQPPMLITQKGETASGSESAEAILLFGASVKDGKAEQAGESLMIWKSRQSLMLDGKNYGDYYLYSEPFKVMVE